MKSDKKLEKDPIKDKYTRKIGFFKKIHLKYLLFINKIKNNKGLIKEVDSGFSLIGEVVLYGILGGLALSLFGVGISVLNVLGIGALLWLIDNKFVEFVTRILGSIKLVNIYS